jgi:hypothetical protein
MHYARLYPRFVPTWLARDKSVPLSAENVTGRARTNLPWPFDSRSAVGSPKFAWLSSLTSTEACTTLLRERPAVLVLS